MTCESATSEAPVGRVVKMNHLVVTCMEAKARAVEHCLRYGFRPFAHGKTAAGCDLFAVGKNGMVFVYEQVDDPARISASGDTVSDVVLQVTSVDLAYKHAVHDGGRAVSRAAPADLGAGVRTAKVSTPFPSVSHTLLEITDADAAAKHVFLPGYEAISTADWPELAGADELPDTLVTDIDHITFACEENTMHDVIDWYAKSFHFSRFYVAADEDEQDGMTVFGNLTGLKLMALEFWRCSEAGVMCNEDCKFTLVEAVQGDGPNQVQMFLDAHSGPGVQHIAFHTPDIVTSAQCMRKQGVVFMDPPASYYTPLGKKGEIDETGEDLARLRSEGILLDISGKDEEGKPEYLMQAFTRPCFDRYTMFMEVITRHKTTGFGAGNVKALFRSLEAYVDSYRPVPADSEPFTIVFADEIFDEALYRRWSSDRREQGINVRMVAPHCAADELVSWVLDADVIISSFLPITAEVIDAAPNCRLIMAQGSGYNHIDVAHAQAKNIRVCSNPHWSTAQVAEHAIGLLMALGTGTERLSREMHTSKGEWPRMDPASQSRAGNQAVRATIQGRVLGVVGLGQIGRDVAERALAIGLQVIFTDHHVKSSANPAFVYVDSLEELLERADFVSLHARSADCLMNDDTFELMKEGSYLINTARGSLVDEHALARALTSGHLRGAALDVFQVEPLPADSPLLGLANCILTPHCAGITPESMRIGAQGVVAEIDAVLENSPARQPITGPATDTSTTAAAPTAKLNMRDIYDQCTELGVENVAAGLTEIPPPTKLMEIASKWMLAEPQAHRYRRREGELVLINALESMYATHYNAPHVKAENMTVTSGVTGGLHATLRMLKSQRRTRIALTAPFYTYHQMTIESVFGDDHPIIFLDMYFDEAQQRWRINDDALATALRQGLDALLVSNPHNPTGNVFSEADIREWMAQMRPSGAMLILDEIYADMLPKDSDFWSPCLDADALNSGNAVVIRGFAKQAGVGSWRLGYAISTPNNIQAIIKQHDPIYISGSALQHAMGEYLGENLDDFGRHVGETMATMQENNRIMSDAVHKVLGWTTYPSLGGMYALWKHDEKSDDDAFDKAIRAGVGIAPGAIFMPGACKRTGWMRIHLNFPTDKAQRIADAVLGSASQ